LRYRNAQMPQNERVSRALSPHRAVDDERRRFFMRKIILASVAAGALAAGIVAASAAEPGEEQYFAQRGNFDASVQQNANPGVNGWNQGYGYGSGYSYQSSPMGYAPMGPVYGPADDYGDYED
jgi:hypothetical protein